MGVLEKKDLRKITHKEMDCYKPAKAPKRRLITDETSIFKEIPEKILIKDDDTEKTIAKKRKLLKSFKKQKRFAEINFLQIKKSKTVGARRESIFRTCMNSKVGVVSG